MNRTRRNVIARRNAAAAAAVTASAINHKSLFYEYSEPAAKITSVARDRSAFPSFLYPYAVVLSSPYANATASDTPPVLPRSRVHPVVCTRAIPNNFARRRTDEQWCRAIFLPFIRLLWESPAVKRLEEKWLVTVRSRDLSNEARNLVKCAPGKREREPLVSSFLLFFFFSFKFSSYAREWNYRSPSRTFRTVDDKFVLPSAKRSVGSVRKSVVCD